MSYLSWISFDDSSVKGIGTVEKNGALSANSGVSSVSSAGSSVLGGAVDSAFSL